MPNDPESDDPAGYLRSLHHTNPEETAHFAALGQFISAYADAEAAVTVAARGVSGPPDSKARIMFANMRLSDIVDRTRAIPRLRRRKGDQEFREEIEACLDQLDKITKRRNALVHRTVHFDEGSLVISNCAQAKFRVSIEMDRVSIAELANMYSDCVSIFLRLASALYPEWEPRPERRAAMRQWPWHYKPPKQDTPKKPHQRAARAPKRQLAHLGRSLT